MTPATRRSATTGRDSSGRRLGTWLASTASGLLLAVTVAAIAVVTASVLPSMIGPVLVAVILGLVIGNTVTLPTSTKPGLSVASNRVLRLGVILLGARLTLRDVVSIGGHALWVVVICMTAGFVTVALLSRATNVPSRLATLIGVGTAVCGNSAIMATAPIIEADDREISFSVATITIFGTASLLLFPLVAHVADLPDDVFGFWAGLSINDTSQVVAAGAAYSAEAFEVATIVKLVRNALMAPLLLLIAWNSVRRAMRVEGADRSDVRRSALHAFPAFILGFLAMAALRSGDIISKELAGTFSELATVSIVVAISAVGLNTKIADLRQVGLKPFVVGCGAAIVLAVVGLLFAKWLAS